MRPLLNSTLNNLLDGRFAAVLFEFLIINIMNLEIPIPTQFSVFLETDKAIIARDIVIDGQNFLAEAILPKTCVNVNAKDKKSGVVSADVEKWVLAQRKKESRNLDVQNEIADLLAMNEMPF